MFQSCVTSLKSLRNKSLLFLIIQLFYLPFVFSENNSENTLKAKSSWTCELDQECLSYLRIDLNKEDNSSIYKACQYEYDTVKTCCESLNKCPNRYGVDRELRNLKSNLLNTASNQAGCSAGNMSSLMSSIQGLQKNTCGLGAKNCKLICEERLTNLKRRIKRCFSISSSIDEALKQAKQADFGTHCYSQLKKVFNQYKRQSRKGTSELREDLSVQDIVDCEGVKNKANATVGTKKAMEICSEAGQELLQRQQAERQKKEEEERQAREEAKKREEEERQREAEEEERRLASEKLSEEMAKYADELDKSAEKRRKAIESHKAHMKEAYGRDLDKEEELARQKIQTEGKEQAKEAEKDTEKETEKGKSAEQTKEETEKAKKKEDESKEVDKKDEKQEKKEPKEEKKKEKSKTKDTKASGGSKAGAVAVTGAVLGAGLQTASSQTTSSLNSSSLQTKKPKSKAKKAKKTVSKKTEDKNLRVSSNNNNKQTSKTNTNQKAQPKQSQASQNSSISSLAGNTDNTDCPDGMPIIKSAVVYQSVEAPQIEPIDKQEIQKDPDNPSFKSYDLVYRKPAGVLVEIDNFQHPIETFHLSLNIKGNPEREVLNCFHSPLNDQTMYEGNETECSFTSYDILSDDKYKFIPFPKKVGLAGQTKTAVVKLYNKNYNECEIKKSFKLNIIKIRPLDLGFTGISDKTCKTKKNGYKFKASNKISLVEGFMESQEVFEYIEAMFPIHSLRTTFVVTEDNKKTMIIGSCNNRYVFNNIDISAGILEDIKKLENKRKEFDFHKIVAIVPQDYFRFHFKKPQNKEAWGMVVHPVWNQPIRILKTFLKPKWLGGSWNITLVREGTNDIGVISHELGHLLRQGKEYYQLRDDNGDVLPDSQQSKCQKFKGNSEELCYKYKIKLGLKTKTVQTIDVITHSTQKQLLWSFVQDKFSIMNSKPPISTNLWIDRETYQKTFKTLSEREGGVATMEEYFLDDDSRRQVVFSGLYDTKKNQIIISDTKLTRSHIKTKSISKTSGIPFISFQLKYNNKVIKNVNQPMIGLEIKLIYKDGTHKKIPNSLSPFSVSFDVNKSYTNKTFQIGIVNPESEELVSSRGFYIKPSQKEKKKKKEKKNKNKQKNKKIDFALLFDDFN